MKHLMQEGNSFSKINWECAVTLNPFVGFGKCVFGWQFDTNIFEKKLLTYQYFRFESVHGETMLKMGWVVKKWNFFLLNGIKSVKMHSDCKLIHLAINIY